MVYQRLNRPMPTSTSNPKPVALLGGTFDPIHLGHTRPALQLADYFGWSRIHLQPCFAPPHRPAPKVSDAHRLNMVELACEDDPRLFADDFELKQGQPTRTVHTLAALQQQHPGASLCFIMGMDSFINFTSWLDWEGILARAHLCVLPRPGYALEQVPAPLMNHVMRHEDDAPAALSMGSGRVYVANTEPLDISATALRASLAQPEAAIHNPCPTLLSPQVYAYIRAHKLYR